MQIERLRIRDFRCFEQVDIAPDPQLNVIVGDNASGKTSLLEALFFLGRGQSFRQSAARPAVRKGARAFTINADVREPGHRRHRVSMGSQQPIQKTCDAFKSSTRSGDAGDVTATHASHREAWVAVTSPPSLTPKVTCPPLTMRKLVALSG